MNILGDVSRVVGVVREKEWAVLGMVVGSLWIVMYECLEIFRKMFFLWRNFEGEKIIRENEVKGGVEGKSVKTRETALKKRQMRIREKGLNGYKKKKPRKGKRKNWASSKIIWKKQKFAVKNRKAKNFKGKLARSKDAKLDMSKDVDRRIQNRRKFGIKITPNLKNRVKFMEKNIIRKNAFNIRKRQKSPYKSKIKKKQKSPFNSKIRKMPVNKKIKKDQENQTPNLYRIFPQINSLRYIVIQTIVASSQNLRSIQKFGLTTFQSIFFLYVILGIFRTKYWSGFWQVFGVLVEEVCIMVFLVLYVVIERGTEGVKIWDDLFGIFCLVLPLILEIVKIGIEILKKWKLKNLVEE
jgi:hypothetical protein